MSRAECRDAIFPHRVGLTPGEDRRRGGQNDPRHEHGGPHPLPSPFPGQVGNEHRGQELQRSGDCDPDPAARLMRPIRKRPEDEEHLGQLDGALSDGGVEGREIQPDEREKRPLHPSGEIEQLAAHQPEGRPDRAPQREKNQPVDQAVGAQEGQGKGEYMKPGTVTPVPLKADVTRAENVVLQESRIVGLGEGRGEGRIEIPGGEAGGRIHAPVQESQEPVGQEHDAGRSYPFLVAHPLPSPSRRKRPGRPPRESIRGRLDDSTAGRLHARQAAVEALARRPGCD